MKNISIKRKALTCLSTAALMAAMVPGVAMAVPRTDLTANVTLTGLQEGDTVEAYEIVDSQVDDPTNNFTRKSNLSGYDTKMSNEDLGKLVNSATLDTIKAAAFNKTAVTATADKDGNASFTGLDDGSWLFIVTNAEGHHRVYQNTVVSTEAKQEKGVYVAADPQFSSVKFTESPAPSKKITIDGKEVESGSIQIGQDYNFSVSFGVPTYPTSAINRQLVVTDTPTGFVDDTNTIQVTRENGDAVDASNYNVTKKGDGFTLNFTDGFIKDNPNAQLVLTYTAKAKSADALTGEAFNNVQVNEGSDKVETKTYGFYFEKTGKDGNSSEALPGATFTLKNGDDVVGTCTSDSNGYVYFSGLQDGVTYTVSETHVPTGYQAAGDFDVTISKDSANGDNPATTDKKETNFQQSGKKDNQVVDAKQGALPTTGGAGTIGLTVAGVVLVAGGATLVLRARKNNE